MTRPLTAMTTTPTDPLSEVSPSRRLAPIGSNCSHPHVVTRCIAVICRGVQVKDQWAFAARRLAVRLAGAWITGALSLPLSIVGTLLAD
jgi:hypothetical protein